MRRTETTKHFKRPSDTPRLQSPESVSNAQHRVGARPRRQRAFFVVPPCMRHTTVRPCLSLTRESQNAPGPPQPLDSLLDWPEPVCESFCHDLCRFCKAKPAPQPQHQCATLCSKSDFVAHSYPGESPPPSPFSLHLVSTKPLTVG